MAKRQLDQFDLEAEREGSAVVSSGSFDAWESVGNESSDKGRKDAEAAIERRTVHTLDEDLMTQDHALGFTILSLLLLRYGCFFLYAQEIL